MDYQLVKLINNPTLDYFKSLALQIIGSDQQAFLLSVGVLTQW